MKNNFKHYVMAIGIISFSTIVPICTLILIGFAIDRPGLIHGALIAGGVFLFLGVAMTRL